MFDIEVTMQNVLLKQKSVGLIVFFFLTIGFNHAALSASAFDAYVAITSDFVFRGVSQSEEEPVIQAGVSTEFDRHWYAQLFYSQVEFGDADNQINLMGGYKNRWKKHLDYSFEYKQILFTGTDIDLDYSELTAKAEYAKKFELSLNYSNDYYNTGEDAMYLEGRFNVPLNDLIHLSTYVGRLDWGDNNFLSSDDYFVYGVDASTQIAEVKLSFSFSDTNIDSTDIADARLFFSVEYFF